jgi:hypothetical protein
MDVGSRRVSSIHAWMGRRSRGSEISSSGEVWVGTTRSGCVGFFLCFPAADLGAAVDLGSGFLGLAVFLVSVTLGCSGAFVTG